jgi:hypothetical protein
MLVRMYAQVHPVLASFAAFVVLTAAASAAAGLVRPHHGPRGRHKIHHDYTKIEYNYNFRASQMDHWCLFGEDTDCSCEDFTDPVPRRETHGWNEAFARNQKRAVAAKNLVLDVVVLGDGLVEIWNGRGLEAPAAIPNGKEIQRIWNETFTRAGGGALEGVALGIKGDSVRGL